MSRFSKDSKFRIREFQRRKRYALESVYVHKSMAQEYIPIHPFSDDTELLAQLKISPTDCRNVDAWWHMGSDVCLLSVSAIDPRSEHKLGIYAAWPKLKQQPLYIMALLETDNVTRAEFEQVMLRVCGLELQATETLRQRLSKRLIHIGSIE